MGWSGLKNYIKNIRKKCRELGVCDSVYYCPFVEVDYHDGLERVKPVPPIPASEIKIKKIPPPGELSDKLWEETKRMQQIVVSDYPKMYILIKDTIPLGLAMNAVGHGALACYLEFQDDPMMKEWLETSFRKVTCKVSEKEFEQAKKRKEPHIVMTELALDKEETAVVFKPAKEFSRFFIFLNLYKE